MIIVITVSISIVIIHSISTVIIVSMIIIAILLRIDYENRRQPVQGKRGRKWLRA